MGKKSKRDRKKPEKKGFVETLLSALDLPIPYDGPDGPVDPKDNRQLADFCIKNFNLMNSNKEAKNRFVILIIHGHAVTMTDDRDDDPVWNKQDHKFYMKKHDKESQRICLETILELCDNATDAEKKVVYTNPFTLDYSRQTIGEDLARMRATASEQLQKLYGLTPEQIFRSGGGVMTPNVCGGTRCDKCKKSREELRMTRLLCCAKCKLEFYCSIDCQESAWKNGHKELCRVKGDFRPGDQVLRKDGHGAKKSRGARRTLLIEQVEREKSWIAEDTWDKTQFVVSTKNLIRLRPVLWQCIEKARHFHNDLSESEQLAYLQDNHDRQQKRALDYYQQLDQSERSSFQEVFDRVRAGWNPEADEEQEQEFESAVANIAQENGAELDEGMAQTKKA